MRSMIRVLSLATLVAAGTSLSRAQETPNPTPTPAPAPPPAAAVTPPPTPSAADVALPLPTPIAPAAMRIRDVPSITVEKLSADDPFGKTADVPATLPPKLAFADVSLPAAFFVSIHVDPTSKVLSVRRDRDPIPSQAAESLKSMSRWSFSPGRKGGQPVDTWGAYRIDLDVEFRSPKVAQVAFTPVTPATPIPKPFDWKSDTEWLDSRHVEPPQDGSVPIDQVDTTPIPQKSPWSADSYKGPFSIKYWVLVDKTGRITRAIPLEISDPVLLPYFRSSMATWTVRPAQTGGAAVDSWNELTLGGQISYSDDIKQIVALKRAIGP